MTIKYEPREFLKKIAPRRKVEKLITRKLTLNRAALSLLEGGRDFISKPTLEKTALKVIKGYKQKYQDLRKDGEKVADALDQATHENQLLINRVQNSIVNQVAQEIRDRYRGEYYIWLPSDAEEPNPLHQLNYGKRFQIGVGEMPGERSGCRCGMEILVNEDQLEL